MKAKRILHITPWYPSAENKMEAIWIERHIAALEPYALNEVLHLHLPEGAWSFNHTNTGNLRKVQFSSPIKSWFIKELIATALLLLILPVHYPARKYDLWNFHIAYPNLVYLSQLKSLFKVPFLVTEHWSYYHFHFYSKMKLRRVKELFRVGIPLITVSESLKKSIEEFAGFRVDAKVIPNAVDEKRFFHRNQERHDHYLMVAFWKEPKDPLVVIEAMAELADSGKPISLKIGGYGPLMPQIEAAIQRLKLEDKVELLGILDTNDLAIALSDCKALLVPSKYETFSVITAEALMCGCPVIASEAGALPELILPEDGILVKENGWAAVLGADFSFHSEEIAQRARQRFASSVVGLNYSNYIDELIEKAGA